MANLKIGNITFKSKAHKNKALQIINTYNNRRKSHVKKLLKEMRNELEK